MTVDGSWMPMKPSRADAEKADGNRQAAHSADAIKNFFMGRKGDSFIFARTGIPNFVYTPSDQERPSTIWY